MATSTGVMSFPKYIVGKHKCKKPPYFKIWDNKSNIFVVPILATSINCILPSKILQFLNIYTVIF